MILMIHKSLNHQDLVHVSDAVAVVAALAAAIAAAAVAVVAAKIGTSTKEHREESAPGLFCFQSPGKTEKSDGQK